MKDSGQQAGNWFINHITHWLNKEAPASRQYLCDFERIRFEIRTADVLLIEGRSRASRVIKQVTQSAWSHAALYIGRLHDIQDPKHRDHVIRQYSGPQDEQLLIESVLGKGTIVTPLSEYQQDHIRICRPVGLSGQDAKHIIEFAISHLGRIYSLQHIFDLFRFLFPWGILPRKWRSSLFEHNAMLPTHDICSSMIAEAFSSVNFPILPHIKNEKGEFELIKRNPKLFTPSDFDYSPYFAIIKYPFFSVSERGQYRDLPWSKQQKTHDEE